jgi:hypothetical protein
MERDYKQMVDSINTNSKANFVQRLNEKELRTIPNWEGDGVVSHRMSYAERDGKYYVYPNVQEIDGSLHDFTDPKYKHGKWDAFDSAYKRGDVIEMPDENSAAWFAENNYKRFYPSFKRAETAAWLNRVLKK